MHHRRVLSNDGLHLFACADWQLLHGEAVGLGLIAAARLSHRLGLAPADLEPRVTAGLAATGLDAAEKRFLETLAAHGVTR